MDKIREYLVAQETPEAKAAAKTAQLAQTTAPRVVQARLEPESEAQQLFTCEVIR